MRKVIKIVAYIFLGLVVAAVLALFFMGNKSQNGAAPGLVDGRLSSCPTKPNCVSSEEGADVEHKIAAFAGTDLTALKTAIEAAGGVVTSADGSYLSAEFTSSIFKFVDDVEGRQDGDVVHIRSASRVGHSDKGVNRARVEAIRAALKQE